jgi:subtilase family serine protease
MNMKNIKKLVFSLPVLVAIFSLGLYHVADAAPHSFHLLNGSHRRVCDLSSANTSGCFAQVETDKSGNPSVASLPSGYGPAQLHGAYQLPTTASNPATIGIVDAYDDPYIASDLASYDSTFGLPSFPSCSNTVKTACFSKVNQNGTTSYPQQSTSWGLETSLDVETAHEICQNCKIVLVEANSSSYTSLMTAVDRARLEGASVISNSYGSSEFYGENSYDSHFKYPGIAFVFSSGDGGYGATYPASSPYVTAVGGTSLTVNTSNAWQAESVWSGSGSGCSAYESKPSFQTDSGCARRTVADLSADADPNTGAAVYDSFGYMGYRGWFQVGGTSLATPIIAGAYALANNIPAASYANSVVYANHKFGLNIHDITTGQTSNCGNYLCEATTGYDGPSGLGTPEGLGAF